MHENTTSYLEYLIFFFLKKMKMYSVLIGTRYVSVIVLFASTRAISCEEVPSGRPPFTITYHLLSNACSQLVPLIPRTLQTYCSLNIFQINFIEKLQYFIYLKENIFLRDYINTEWKKYILDVNGSQVMDKIQVNGVYILHFLISFEYYHYI